MDIEKDEREKSEENLADEKPVKKVKKIIRVAKRIASFVAKAVMALWNSRASALADIKGAFCHIDPRKAILATLLGVICVYMLTGIYIVNPGERAVVRRFGAILPGTVSEGLHYRWPYPIEQAQIVNVEEIRRADVGLSLPEHMHTDDTPDAVQLLTGDENIIASEAIVHYRVKDAAKFLYSVNNNSEQLVRYSVESALVKMMSGMLVDNILSTEKVAAQNSVIKDAQATLDGYDSGIQITAFNIQNIVPPGAVSEAFRDVIAAREDRERAINQARGYYNSLIPEARGKANAMLAQAQAYKVEKINLSTGDADKFKSILAEYQKNSETNERDTTKYRLMLETFEKILPRAKKYIVDSAESTVDVKLFDPGMAAGIAAEAIRNP
ncbi:MAG: FtsH protease activity modulator HflK [Synergistaceae bacterium]|jgi:membrane protease subunit HflK|nr:FtsH protease activity modulator HflK [Synergistaceae bacterium]